MKSAAHRVDPEAEAPLSRRAHTIALAALALSVLRCAQPVRAAPISACTVADIIAHDPGCPSGTGPCSITQTFQVGDGCTLDFGTRNVTISSSGVIDINSGDVTIKAGSFTVAGGGLIDGRGNASGPPGNLGGMITIQTTDAVTVQKTGRTSGAIDVSANAQAGTIAIFAGGSITVSGRINADQLVGAATATGGIIQLNAGGDIVSFVGSDISASGGNQSIGGGEIDLFAGGKVTLADVIDISGSCGGNFNLTAGTVATVDLVNSNGTGDGGSGGCVDVTSGTNVLVIDKLLAQGNESPTGSGGGGGGLVCIAAQSGDVAIGADLMAEGASPDGAGGEIDLCSQGAMTINAGKTVSARGNGSQSSGGVVCLQSELGISSLGVVDASGGTGGGEVDVLARADVTLSGKVDVSGRSIGGNGGKANLTAGDDGQGSLSIKSPVDATGGACMVGNVGCGLGGSTNLAACSLTVASTGSVLAGAPKAGQNSLVAREQLTLSGKVNAAKTIGSGTDGTNFFQFARRRPPLIGSNLVAPAPILLGLDACTFANQSNCLIPCPVCGNGVTEFPETCDNNVGTPLSCDGCSAFCQAENCDDGNVCTIDTCDPMRGCQHALVSASCVTPTPTPGPPTPTRTRTRPPGTPSPTPIATSTGTATVKPSQTPTPETPIPTSTVGDTPTETPTPGPPADVNCDAGVTAADLPALITLVTAESPFNLCGTGDVDGNGAINASDIDAVISMLFEP